MAGATLALHLSAAAPTDHLALQKAVYIAIGVNLNGRKEVLGCG